MSKWTQLLNITLEDASGETYDLQAFDGYSLYYIKSEALVATGNFSFGEDSEDTLYEGLTYNYRYEANVDLLTNNANLSFHGTTVPRNWGNKKFSVKAIYNNTSWAVALSLDNLEDTVTEINLADKSVTLPKMADLARGSIILGNNEGRPAAYDAKTSGRILVGDGTDLNSVAVSGDVTLASSGAVTISNGVVTNAKLAAMTRGRVKVGNSSNVASDLNASGNGAMLIGDGSDVNAVVISGDITINSSGVATIATDGVTNAKLANMAEGTVKVGGTSNAPTDLDNKAAGALIIGNGTGVSSQVVSGDATLSALGVLTIEDDTIDTDKLVDDNVTVAKVSQNLKYETLSLEVSFEAGEQGNTKLKLPFGGTLVEAYAFATKDIAGTDNGTIVLKNHAGSTMTGGTITFTASDLRETEYTVTPSSNNVFAIEQFLTVTTSKSTDGGKVLLQLKFLKA